MRKRKVGRPKGSKNHVAAPVSDVRQVRRERAPAPMSPDDIAAAVAASITTPRDHFINMWLEYSSVQHIDESLMPATSRPRFARRREEAKDAFDRAAAHFASYLCVTIRKGRLEGNGHA